MAFRSVAPRLIEADVGSVMAMSYAVHVEAAKILIERFYRELARGRTIGQAMEHGRGALMAQPDRWLAYGPRGKTIQLQDWFLPQLYQRGGDMALVGTVTRDTVHESPPANRPLFPTGDQIGAFPRPPFYDFFFLPTAARASCITSNASSAPIGQSCCTPWAAWARRCWHERPLSG